MLNWHTLSNNILNRIPLLLRKQPFVFLAQFGYDEWSDGGEDARQDRVSGVEEPAGVRGVIEVDSTFQDGVFADSEVSSNGGHVDVTS